MNATVSSGLPVMFFIHGGGFESGDSRGDPAIPLLTTSLYEGQALANNNNVIVVTINYRLDVFGFLALEELMQEDTQYKSTGNYGLQDTRKALQWVQTNIANFGGDPKRVMMFGESAGGISVCANVVNPLAAGLFSRALGESPLCAGKLPFTQLPIALNWGKLTSEKVGCNMNGTARLDCLRGLSTSDAFPFDSRTPMPPNPPGAPRLPWGIPEFNWMPAVDGSPNGMLDEPLTLVQKGLFNDVPIVLGTNKNEGSAFIVAVANIVGVKLPLDQEKFLKIVDYMWPNPGQGEAVTGVYNLTSYANYDLAGEALLRDYFLSCPARAFIREINKWRQENNSKNLNKQWLYLFERVYDSPIYKLMGDMHAIELFWVFDHPLTVVDKWLPADTTLALEMGAYWSALARSGDPNQYMNCPTCIPWPYFASLPNSTNPAEATNVCFKQGLVTEMGMYQDTCDFWDNFGYLA
jgi:para-nitrobenzyl esterase